MLEKVKKKMKKKMELKEEGWKEMRNLKEMVIENENMDLKVIVQRDGRKESKIVKEKERMSEMEKKKRMRNLRRMREG